MTACTPSRFGVRQLRHDTLADADLVLGAAPRHRSSVLEEFPDLLDRTFSLREFARLASAVPQETTLPPELLKCARSIVDGARGMRRLVPTPDGDEVPDPTGGPPELHQQFTALIFEALRTILDVIAPRPASQPPSPPRRRLPPVAPQYPYPEHRR